MSWAAGRRTFILAIIGGALAAVVVLVLLAALHKEPTCADGLMNQDERGVDCGGACSRICTADVTPPIVSFVRAIPNGARTDVIAYIENPNQEYAARAVRYQVELYDGSRAIVAKKEGTVDLQPGLVVPVFIANAYAGDAAVSRAFLTLDDASFWWRRAGSAPVLPVMGSAEVVGTLEAPRVIATVTNPSVDSMRSVRLVATVFDEAGNAMAASQTIIPQIGPNERADATFTWSAAFPATVARIDVRPVLPLSAP